MGPQLWPEPTGASTEGTQPGQRPPTRNEREKCDLKNEQRLKDLQKENIRLSVCVYWSPRMKREKVFEEIMA